jgi:hypothetical protein
MIALMLILGMFDHHDGGDEASPLATLIGLGLALGLVPVLFVTVLLSLG